MLKKIISILVVLILCFWLLNVGVSAKVAQPTNTLKTNGNGGKTDVGTWFITYNSKGIFTNNMGSGYPIRYKMLMPDGSYGILDSSTVEHIDFQLEKLAEAKIDFILFDLTNGGISSKVSFGRGNESGAGVDNAKLTCERISKWNDTHDWKIKYSVAVGCYQAIRAGLSIGEATEYQAKGVYEKFFTNETYGGDDYYQVDGKPLLIIHDWGEDVLRLPHGWKYYKGDRTYGDKFFVRNGQGGEKGTYGWYCRYKTSIVDEEVMLVSPGQRNAGNTKANAPRDNGNLYLTCWESVLNNTLPRIVMISSFNDYCEQTAVWTADSSKCKGDFDEKWTDSTGEINNSMYWDMTVEGIKLVRIANGELKGEWKSEWFDLGSGRPVKTGANVSDKDDSQDTQNDSSSDTKDDNTQTLQNSTIKDTSKVVKKSNSALIITVIIVTVVLVLGAAVFLAVYLLKQKRKVKNANEKNN